MDEMAVDSTPRPTLHRSKTTSAQTRAGPKTDDGSKQGLNRSATTSSRDKKKTVGLFSNFFPGPLPPHLEKK